MFLEPPEVTNKEPLPERLLIHQFYKKMSTEKFLYIEFFKPFRT